MHSTEFEGYGSLVFNVAENNNDDLTKSNIMLTVSIGINKQLPTMNSDEQPLQGDVVQLPDLI